MGTLLIEHWLGSADRVAVVDDASLSEVREGVRALGRAIGLTTVPCENLVAAASELARNQLAYTRGGTIGLRSIVRGDVAGVEVIAADLGQGIADPTAALRGTPRVSGSLGVGLSAAARQADEIDLDVRIGNGSCVRIRTFASPLPKREVGIFATAHPDESVIGDHATVVYDTNVLVVAVADGLGHGVLARHAADLACGELLRDPGRSIVDTLTAAHAALPGTRGAVMSVVRLDERGHFEHAGVGNISTRVITLDGTARPLPSSAGTLGSILPRRMHVEHASIAPGELLVMSSDGLATRFDLASDQVTVRQHPIVVAQTLLSRFARGSDDALVAVLR